MDGGHYFKKSLEKIGDAEPTAFSIRDLFEKLNFKKCTNEGGFEYDIVAGQGKAKEYVKIENLKFHGDYLRLIQVGGNAVYAIDEDKIYGSNEMGQFILMAVRNV